MNNEFRFLPHTTSGTRTSAKPSPAQGFAVAPRQADRTQTLLAELVEGNFKNLWLRCPMPVHVKWSEEMHCFLAVDEIFHWHGQGDSAQDAIQDLAEVIAEDYDDLRNWPGKLSVPLQERLTVMKRYFENAR